MSNENQKTSESSLDSTALLGIGISVTVKDGASEWMKDRDYWLDEWPDYIDGMTGTIINDYTDYKDDDCHYEVKIVGVEGCGIHPMFLLPNPEVTRG